MRTFLTRGLIGLLAWLPALGAQTATDLPQRAQIIAAIDSDPTVVQARRSLEAAAHAAAMLDASPNEWIANTTLQRRRVNGEGTSNEWTAGIDRAIRVNGKAALDKELGNAGLQLAAAQLGAARVVAAHAILDLWLHRVASAQSTRLLQEQLESAQANLNAVEARRRAGDATLIDVSVARGDLAEVRRQLSVAVAAETRDTTTLRLRYPALPADTGTLGEPLPLEGSETQWLNRVLAASEQLRAARESLRSAELTATRAGANRVPDPTIGVFTASESFRNEKLMGVRLSIPLSGTYRREAELEALQRAEAARAALEQERKDVQVRVAVLVAQVSSSVDRWRLAEQSAAEARESARLTQRAYSLGESDLQTVLLARRQSLEAAIAAVSSRADAIRARYELLIDAHQLWDLDTPG